MLDFATLALTLQCPERRGFSVGTKLIELVQRATTISNKQASNKPKNQQPPIELWPDIYWRRKKIGENSKRLSRRDFSNVSVNEEICTKMFQSIN